MACKITDERSYHRFKTIIIIILIALPFGLSFCKTYKYKSTRADESQWILKSLKPSANKRYLTDRDNVPVFLIGGTAWTMPENCTREDVDYYLNDRKKKGFNYVQIVAVRDFGGEQAIEDQTKHGTMNPENCYGHRPFEWGRNEKADVSKPIIEEGGSPIEPNDYWDHLDYIVQKTESLGMYIGILPAWGKYYINNNDPDMRLFTESTAFNYGFFIGDRYREYPHIIWILGGDIWKIDRPVDCRPIYRKMAEGIAKGVTGHAPSWNESDPVWEEVMITFHINGTSATYFNDDAWLSLNMIESSDPDLYEVVSKSYNTTPIRPLLHGEGWYEGWIFTDEYKSARVTRRQMYHVIFGGGLGGCVYGVAQTNKGLKDQLTKFRPGWRDRLDTEGAQAVRPLRNLLDQRNWWELEPDQSLIVSGKGSGETLKAACISSEGNEILVFFADNTPALISLDGISSHDSAKAVWFDPGNGYTSDEGMFSTNQIITFRPPEEWEDAVLIIEGVESKVTTGRMKKNIFPEEEWLVSSPEQQGVNSEKMMKAMNYLKSSVNKNGIDEVIIVRNGYVIFEGSNTSRVHSVWSCGKTFTSTVLGLLIDEGTVSLDDYAADYEPLLQEFYPNVTFRHFTTMTSGYNATGKNRWDGISEDWSWTPYDPDKPFYPPGTEYAYWDEAMLMFGRVLTRILNGTMESYLKEKIGIPIGMEFTWEHEGDLQGLSINNGSGAVHINAKNFARWGWLFLNKGNWDGVQLLSKKWINEAASVQVSSTIPVADTDRKDTEGSGCYGFNWWVNCKKADGNLKLPGAPEGIFWASELNNNRCFVIPQWNMVVVRMGTDGNIDNADEVYGTFIEMLGDALVD